MEVEFVEEEEDGVVGGGVRVGKDKVKEMVMSGSSDGVAREIETCIVKKRQEMQDNIVLVKENNMVKQRKYYQTTTSSYLG
uniref:Uncharacterized protein n=1 Tax=Oryza sativa subsp. japonica TaxID=39947 RepID=Q6YYF9_ORYSJ|nr:hypothetical protein [Oryza sativa Japonica Group]BAD16269.1 hypothetical protein [Oryza sativa Japonica Group]